MWQEFKDFAFKGNVLDMAVGVIIGSAFGKIVTSLVSDIITPLIGRLTSGIDLKDLKFTLSVAADGTVNSINYGMFLQNVIDFLIIAFCIFLFIQLINTAKEKFIKKQEIKEEVVKGPTTEELLTQIRDLIKENKQEVPPSDENRTENDM